MVKLFFSAILFFYVANAVTKLYLLTKAGKCQFQELQNDLNWLSLQRLCALVSFNLKNLKLSVVGPHDGFWIHGKI